MRPKICLSLNCKNIDEIKDELNKYLAYADIVELCADKLEGIENYTKDQFLELLKKVRVYIKEKKLIVDFKGEQNLQDKIICWAMGVADIVDIDFENPNRDSLIKEAKARLTLVLLSSHDFNKMLSRKEVYNKFLLMDKTEANILKIACKANSKEDKFEVLEGAKEYSSIPKAKDIVAIAMGENGKESRVIMGEYNSTISYACGTIETAPGQYNAMELYKLIKEHYGNN